MFIDAVESIYRSSFWFQLVSKHRKLWRWLRPFLWWGISFQREFLFGRSAWSSWIRTPMVALGIYWRSELQDLDFLFYGVILSVPGYQEHGCGLRLKVGWHVKPKEIGSVRERDPA